LNFLLNIFKSFLKWWKNEPTPDRTEYVYSPITKKEIVKPVGFIKSREEQDLDIINFFQPYADPDCIHCYGRGHDGWDAKKNQYGICRCVIKAIEKAKAQKELESQRN
jgi:hypothetical protein